MVLAGVSNREALLALLLFESAWWGTICFGLIIPSFLLYGFMVPTTVATWATIIGILTANGLKLLSVAYFWLASSKRDEASLKSSLKTWFIGSLVLDIVYLLIVAAIGIHFRFPLTSTFPPAFLILRIGFWIFSTFTIRSICQENGDYSEKRFFAVTDIIRNWAWEKSFLIWEVFWNCAVLISNLQSQYFHTAFGMLLPSHYVTHFSTFCVYGLIVVSALIALLGILRSWKTFLKFWLPFYAAAGLGLYTFQNGVELFDHSKDREGFKNHLGIVIDVSIAAVIVLFALFLRSVTLIRCIKFAYSEVSAFAASSQSADLKLGTDSMLADLEKQPLINIPRKKSQES